MIKKTVTPKGKITSKPKPTRIIFNPTRKRVVDLLSDGERVRSGLYTHYCYEWDEMLIDENDPEFAVCLCGMPNPKT